MKIRKAVASDQPVVVEYNRRMAWETERKTLDPAVLNRGVAAVLADRAKGFYLLADHEGDAVGQLMINTEWSDWRNGDFWWIQSVYVREDVRRKGVFRMLFHEVEHLAREAGNVIGLRLYVERENAKAQETYRNLGLEEAGYEFYQRYPL